MQPFISVIIPVYNIERYIGKCLDSIVGQTLKEIEIIVVDDGSTDDSSRIIDRYARTDSRIVAIHKTNGGVVSARNCGIAQATGLYILFVDGDDHLAPDACERLLRKAQATSADMVIMRFDIEYPQHKEEPRFWSQDEYDPVTAIHTMAHEEFRWSLWSRLMRKELFDRPVDCPPQLIFGEDAYPIDLPSPKDSDITGQNPVPLHRPGQFRIATCHDAAKSREYRIIPAIHRTVLTTDS